MTKSYSTDTSADVLKERTMLKPTAEQAPTTTESITRRQLVKFINLFFNSLTKLGI